MFFLIKTIQKKVINTCNLPCQNGGVCYIDSRGQQMCRCPSGFTGYYCQTRKKKNFFLAIRR